MAGRITEFLFSNHRSKPPKVPLMREFLSEESFVSYKKFWEETMRHNIFLHKIGAVKWLGLFVGTTAPVVTGWVDASAMPLGLAIAGITGALTHAKYIRQNNRILCTSN